MSDQIVIHRDELKHTKIDLQGRDLVIGFSEPAFRKDAESLGSPVNARLLSYFLPAVEIAQMQTTVRRPRLIIISGIKAAVKWNARTDLERLIMTVNNNLKKDFIEQALATFFPEVFSLVEIRDTYDFLKIPEQVLNQLWSLFQKRYPAKIHDIELHLKKFRPDTQNPENLFKYSLAHLFGLGDINFDWEPHNAQGYCSIGEHNELIFNEVRAIAQELIEDVGELLFGKEIHLEVNMGEML